MLRELDALLPDHPAVRIRLVRRRVAFAHNLRSALRGSGETTSAWLSEADCPIVRARPDHADAILQLQSRELAGLLADGTLSDRLYVQLGERLHAMTTMQAGCERLQTTPMPFGYTLLLHRTAWLFCLMLPLGLVGTLGLVTPLLTTLLAYTFFGLDALGDQLEAPFDHSHNALPLDAMVRTIERAALQIEGADRLPEPVRPQRYVLS